jgi:chromosome segregation ATPase
MMVMSQLSDQQQQFDSDPGATGKLSIEDTNRVLGSMAPVDRQLQALIEQAEEIGEDRDRLGMVLRDLDSFRELLGGRVTGLKRAAIHIAHEERTVSEQRSLLDQRRREVNERLRQLEHREATLEAYETKIGDENRTLREAKAHLTSETAVVQRERKQLVADQRSLQRQIEEFESNSKDVEGRLASLAADQAAFVVRETALTHQQEELASQEAALASAQDELASLQAKIQSQREALDEETRALEQRFQTVQGREKAVEHLDEEKRDLVAREQRLIDREAEQDARSQNLAEREDSFSAQLTRIETEKSALEERGAELEGLQKRFEKQFEALEGDQAQLAQQQEELAADRANLAAEAEALEEKAASFATRELYFEERDVELTNLANELEGRTTDLREREATLEIERSRIEALERTAAEREESAQQEQANFRAELSGLSSEQKRVAELAQTLALQEAAILQERESLDQGLEDLERGRVSLSNDQKRLASDRAAAELLRVDLEGRSTEIHQRLSELEAEEHRVAQLAESIGQQQAEQLELMASFEQSRQEIDESGRQLKEEQRQLAGQREELQHIRGETERFGQEVRLARAELAEREESFANLEQRQADLEASEAAFRAQEAELENRTNSLKERQEALDQRELNLKRQEEAIQEKARQIEEESASVDAWRTDLNRLRKESLEESELSNEVHLELEELRQQLLAEQASVEGARTGLQKDREDVEAIRGRLDDDVAMFEEEKRLLGLEREEIRQLEGGLKERIESCELREKDLDLRNLEFDQAQAEILDLRDQLDTLESRLKDSEGLLIDPAEISLLRGASRQVVTLQKELEAAQEEAAKARAALSRVTKDVDDDKRRVTDEQDRLLSEMETLRAQLDEQERGREALAVDRQAIEEQYSLQQTELNQKIDELELLKIEHESAERALEARRTDLAELEEKHRQTLAEVEQERHRLEGESKGQYRQSTQDRTAIDKEKRQLQRMADELADERAELHRMRLSIEVRESKMRKSTGSADPSSRGMERRRGAIARFATKATISLLLGAAAGFYVYTNEKPSYAVQGSLAVKYEGEISEGHGEQAGREKLMQNATVLALAQEELGQSLGPLFDPGREDRLLTEIRYDSDEIYFLARRESDEPETARRQVDALLRATQKHLAQVANEGIDPNQGGLLEELAQINSLIAAKDEQIQNDLIPKFADPHPRDVQNRLNEQLAGQRQELERLRAEYDRVAASVRDLRQSADAPKGKLTEADIAKFVDDDGAIQEDTKQLQSQLILANNLIVEALDGSQGRFKAVHTSIDELQKTLTDRAQNETDLSAAAVFESIGQDLASFRNESEVFEKAWNSARENFIHSNSDPLNSSLLERRDDIEKQLKDFQYEANKMLTGFQNAVKGIGAKSASGQTTLQEVSRNVVSRGVHELLQAIAGVSASATNIFLENNLKLNNTVYKVAGMNRSIANRRAAVIQAAQLSADQAASAKYYQTLRQAEAGVDELGRKRDKQVDACMITGREIIELNDAIRIEDELARDLRQAEQELAALQADKAAMDEKLAAIRNVGGVRLLAPGEPQPARRIGSTGELGPRLEKAGMAVGVIAGGVFIILLIATYLDGLVANRRNSRPLMLPLDAAPVTSVETTSETSI